MKTLKFLSKIGFFLLLIVEWNYGIVSAQTQSKMNEDLLYKIFKGKYDELGVETGYVNSKGDTVIALGKYYYCYTDTLKDFAIVMTKQGKLIGIDKNENELYEVFAFDNGPDYISDGLFRIIKDGKIGYADSNGQIIIKPQYDCANPFVNGTADVSNDCHNESDGEHTEWISDKWFYIDKTGKPVLKK